MFRPGTRRRFTTMRIESTSVRGRTFLLPPPTRSKGYIAANTSRKGPGMAKRQKRGSAKSNSEAPALSLGPLLKELQTIRALLMLTILKIGGTTEEIAAALGVTNQRVSQMIPASEIRKLKFESGREAEEE